MEDVKYTKEYLSASGPKWTFSYIFKENLGTILEHETNESFSFKLHYNKFSLLTQEGKERFEKLAEIEKKWIENCASEASFLKKN